MIENSPSGQIFIKYEQAEKDSNFVVFLSLTTMGNDSNLLIVFYVQIMPDDFVMQLHRF